MTGVEEQRNSIKNRQRGKNKRIGFTQEIVTKDAAKTLLSKDFTKYSNESFLAKLNEDVPESKLPNMKKKKGKRDKVSKSPDTQDPEKAFVEINTSKIDKRKRSNVDIEGEERNDTGDPSHKIKKRKEKTESGTKISEPNENEDITSTEKKDADKVLSKRALKKIKHQKLLEDKKLKVDINLQQKALTYLSNWKHDRTNWKFEKLKQIWLLQNLYDSTRIDNKFWNTVVEYFSNSKGKVHKTILEEAIKIIEKEQYLVDDAGKIRLNRARDIVQHLQE